MWQQRFQLTVPFWRVVCALAISTTTGIAGFGFSPSTGERTRDWYLQQQQQQQQQQQTQRQDLTKKPLLTTFPKIFSNHHLTTRCDAGALSQDDDDDVVDANGLEDQSHPKEVETYQPMSIPARGQCDGHAIFGVLLGEDMIEKYEIYQRPKDSDEKNIVIAYVQLGGKVDGHPGVVHGGILSLILDDALGFGYEAIGVSQAVTANLNIDFRAPVLAGTQVRVVAQLEHREGRKLYWQAQMTSMDGKTLYAEATSLYIIPRSKA